MIWKQLLLFLTCLVLSSSSSLKLRCLDPQCTAMISQARVARTIKQQIGDLPVLTSGILVKVFAKNADSSTTLWCIEYNDMFGFVDSSFLKEIGKGKNDELGLVETPVRFVDFFSRSEEKANKILKEGDMEDETEASIEEDTSLNKSNFDDTNSHNLQPKSDVPPISSDHALIKDETEDDEDTSLNNTDLHNSAEIPNQNRNSAESIETTKHHEDTKLTTQQEEAKIEVQKQEAAKLEVQKQEAAKLEVQKQEAAKLEVQKQEAAKLEVQKQEAAKLEAQKQEAAKIEAQKQEEAKLEAQKQEAAKIEAHKQEEAKLEAQKQEEAKLEAQKQEEPKIETLKQEEAKIEVQRQEAAKVEVQQLEAAKPAVQQEAAKPAVQQEDGKPAVQQEDGKPAVQVQEDGKPAVQVQEDGKPAVQVQEDGKAEAQVQEADKLEAKQQKDSKHSEESFNIPVKQQETIKPHEQENVIKEELKTNNEQSFLDDAGNKLYSENIAEPKILIENDVDLNSVNKENMSKPITRTTDPWTGGRPLDSRHVECISILTEQSVLLKLLKYFFDVSIIPIHHSIALMPNDIVVILTTIFPQYTGLSLEAIILCFLSFFIILFWSVLFKCCLCRRNITKELGKWRNFVVSLEEKLTEKDKSNSELADWNGRLVRQVKDYENQVVFLKSDTSSQVKDLTKELEELNCRNDETLNENEVLRERCLKSEESQLTACRELEVQLAGEMERMANTIIDYDQKLALKQSEAERQGGMVVEIAREREQLVSQMNAYYDQMVLMKKDAEQIEANHTALEQTIQERDSELNSLRESFLQLKSFDLVIEEINTDHNITEDEEENGDSDTEKVEGEDSNNIEKSNKSEAIRKKVLEFLDTNKLRFEYNEATERIKHLELRLREETSSRDDVEYRLGELEKEKLSLSSGQIEAEERRMESQKKLDILSQYFKERESEMQRSMGEQEVRKSHTKEQFDSQVSRTKLLETEMTAMREQLTGMRKELEDSERAYRRQTVELERRAHDNWLAARSAEREVKEMKEETLGLRQRLLESEKSRQLPPMPFPPLGGFPRPPANSPPPVLPSGILPSQMGRPGSRHSTSSDKDRPPSRSNAAPPMPRIPFMPPPPPGMPNMHHMPPPPGISGMPPMPPPPGISGMPPMPHPPFGMFMPPPHAMMPLPRNSSMSSMNNTNDNSFQSQ